MAARLRALGRLRWGAPGLAGLAVALEALAGYTEMRTYNHYCTLAIYVGDLPNDPVSYPYSPAQIGITFLMLAVPPLLLPSRLAQRISMAPLALLILVVAGHIVGTFERHDCNTGGHQNFGEGGEILPLLAGLAAAAFNAALLATGLLA